MNELIIAPKGKLPTIIGAVKVGLEVSSGARSTATYYHSKTEQIEAIEHQVKALYAIDKSLPLLLSNIEGATHYFKQIAIKQELQSGANNGQSGIVPPQLWFDEGMQEKALVQAIAKLPITYTLRLFNDMIGKVNNARTQRLMRSYIWSISNDFIFVKYRNKINTILKHAYGKRQHYALIRIAGEITDNKPLSSTDATFWEQSIKGSHLNSVYIAIILLFLDRRLSDYSGDLPSIQHYFACKNAITELVFWKAAHALDNSIVTGLVTSHKNPLYESFFEVVEGKRKLKDSFKKQLLAGSQTMTDEAKLRSTKRMKALGVNKGNVDVSKVSAEAIHKTGFETKSAMTVLANEKAESEKIALPYSNIAIIIDDSKSNEGASDSKNTNKALIAHLSLVLSKSVADHKIYRTTKEHTNLCRPFVQLLKDNSNVEAVFILSDGYENHPYSGALNDLLGKIAGLIDLPPIIHLNPMLSAEMKAQARSLGGRIVTLAVSKPSQIEAQMNMRLLDLNPREWLKIEFSKLLPSPVLAN